MLRALLGLVVATPAIAHCYTAVNTAAPVIFPQPAALLGASYPQAGPPSSSAQDSSGGRSPQVLNNLDLALLRDTYNSQTGRRNYAGSQSPISLGNGVLDNVRIHLLSDTYNRQSDGYYYRQPGLLD